MKKVITITLGIYLNFVNAISRKLGSHHGFLVFCYPFAARLKTQQKAYLDTAEKIVVSVDSKKVRCYKWGNGPQKILMVHGWQSNAFRWRRYIDKLSLEKYTIYAFDAPGHGNSEGRISNVPLWAQSIKAIIEKEGNMDLFIAHSIGSFSSLYFIDEFPDLKPERIICLATPKSVMDFINHYRATLSLSDTTMNNLQAKFSDYVGRQLGHFYIENFKEHTKLQGLIIHDITDKDVPSEYAQILKSNWNQAELLLTKGYGHKLNGEFVISEIEKFTNQVKTEKAQAKVL